MSPHTFPSPPRPPTPPPVKQVHALLARVAECVTYCASRDEVALAMAGNVFKRMYEQAANAGAAARLATQINVSVLARVGSACKKVSAFVADMLLYAGDDERKLHEEIVLSLLLAQVVAMTTLSPRLAKHLTTSRSPHAVAFSAWLVRRTMLDEPLVAALFTIEDSSSPDDATLASVSVTDDARAEADSSLRLPSSLVPVVTVMSKLTVADAERSLRREPSSSHVVSPILSVLAPSRLSATDAFTIASSAVP